MSPSLFFITGLPRTRSAWLANLMTTDKSLCLHDGMRGCNRVDAFLEKLRSKGCFGYRYVGAAGSDLIYAYPQIVARYPKAPWVVVERDRNEALSAYRDKYHDGGSGPDPDGDRSAFFDMSERLHYIIGHRVTFNELDSIGMVASVFFYCCDQLAWSTRRFEVLRDLNVQARPGSMPDPSTAGPLVEALKRSAK